MKPEIGSYSPSSYEGHHQVYCLDQDEGGGMWFGTLGAVLHHNGESWVKVPTETGMGVLSMDIDRKGRIWLGGTSSFGYLRPVGVEAPESEQMGVSDRKGDSGSKLTSGNEHGKSPGDLEYVPLVHLLPDSLKDFKNVWRVHATEKSVVFNTYDRIFILKAPSGKPSRRDKKKGRAGGSPFHFEIIEPSGEFYHTHRVNGDFWVQDLGHGLFQLDLNKNKSKNENSLEKVAGSGPFADMGVRNILEEVPGVLPQKGKDGPEEVLVVTGRSGIYRFDLDSSSSEKDRIEPFAKERWPLFKKAWLYQTLPLDPGKNPYKACLALSTKNKGVMLLDSTGQVVLHLDSEKGMPSDFIWDTKPGASGSGMLWSCTEKGVVRWNPKDPRSYAYEGEGFSGGVKGITRYKGKLFLATGQGLYAQGGENSDQNDPWSLIEGSEGRCSDLLVVKNEKSQIGDMLATTPRFLIQVRSFDGNSKVEGRKWKVKKLIQGQFHTLNELPPFKERAWVATGGRSGVVLLSRKNGGWTQELHIKRLPEGVISFGVISHENEDKNKGELTLWTGLRTEGGIRFRFDRELLTRTPLNDSVRTITYEEARGDSMAGIRVRSFLGKKEARKGLPRGEVRFFTLGERVVAGTDKGIFRPVKKKGEGVRWSHDPAFKCPFGECSGENGKKKRRIFRGKEAMDGSVWIQSGHPYRMIPGASATYGIDSLPFKGMGLGTVRAIYPDSNGVTWFGGNQGIVRYQEDVPKDFKRAYPCFIRKVSAPLHDTARMKKDSVLFGGFYRKPAPKAPLLDWKRAWEQPEAFIPTLPYRMNGLTFHFAAPYYENQEEVTYSYQLVGFDDNWSQWKKATRKEYTNLPEGKYTFRVKAKNVYGVESEVGKYRFRILPPWYRTWAAYGCYTVAGIGLIWLLIWLNSRRLIAQKLRLERIVEERTQEIREKNDRLETANQDIQAEKEKVEEQKEEVEKKKQVITQQKEEVEKQKEKVEEAHREITASIDYAQKIQNALLHSEEYASDHLPEHFILFKPQATVSGDFYWAKEQRGYLYLAAIDCTGHGVPGAFMSMLGINQLNEIMAVNELPTPGEILTELRERVVAELRSGDPEGGAKDGMDAALLRIPLKEGNSREEGRTVQFAGANNPLYVVKERVAEAIPEMAFYRNGRAVEAEAGRVRPFKKNLNGFEVKGEKMAVGYDPNVAKAFTTTELEVPANAMLYMFSDGYADQFGGPKGKKFRYGPFKELLARIQGMSPKEQKQELDRVFEEWKAESEQEQTDDVCVIGVRV